MYIVEDLFLFDSQIWLRSKIRSIPARLWTHRVPVASGNIHQSMPKCRVTRIARLVPIARMIRLNGVCTLRYVRGTKGRSRGGDRKVTVHCRNPCHCFARWLNHRENFRGKLTSTRKARILRNFVRNERSDKLVIILIYRLSPFLKLFLSRENVLNGIPNYFCERILNVCFQLFVSSKWFIPRDNSPVLE